MGDESLSAAQEDNRYRHRLLTALAIAALGFNLRPVAVSVGPILHEIQAGTFASPTEMALLASLPPVSFSVFGALAPSIARVIGVHGTLATSLVALTVALGLRSAVTNATVFLTLSLVALGGMAVANVLLPSLIKYHSPRRTGPATALYTTALALGLTSASALTVPIGRLLGSWRWGLAIWAVTAGLALIPWLALVRGTSAQIQPSPTRPPLRVVARTRLGWGMAGAFGLQATQAYAIFAWFPQLFIDAGHSPASAGILLAVITGVSLPLSFLVPMIAARQTHNGPLLAVLIGCLSGGYLGLEVFPQSRVWLCAVLIGVGQATFPLVLVLINLRTRTPGGTVALSAFTQGLGYLMAAPGPFLVGILYHLTGGWSAPLYLLQILNVSFLVVGWTVSRPGYLEDHLRSVKDGAT